MNTKQEAPRAFIDEHGHIVIVGFDEWNKASFADSDRAFPDSWIRLEPTCFDIVGLLTDVLRGLEQVGLQDGWINYDYSKAIKERVSSALESLAVRT